MADLESGGPTGRRGQKALFLDRDGTLIVHHPYLGDPDKVELLPGVGEGLARLAKAGFALILVTNQSGVARGMFTEQTVQAVNQALADRLQDHGVSLQGTYYCPHLEEGSVAEYSRVCQCRKPALGMIQQAAQEHGIDLQRSFCIGDSLRDVERVGELGVRGILVAQEVSGSHPGLVVVPSFEAAVRVVFLS